MHDGLNLVLVERNRKQKLNHASKTDKSGRIKLGCRLIIKNNMGIRLEYGSTYWD